VPHRRNDDHQLLPPPPGTDHPLRHLTDPLGRRDRAATVLLDDQHDPTGQADPPATPVRAEASTAAVDRSATNVIRRSSPPRCIDRDSPGGRRGSDAASRSPPGSPRRGPDPPATDPGYP